MVLVFNIIYRQIETEWCTYISEKYVLQRRYNKPILFLLGKRISTLCICTMNKKNKKNIHGLD